MTAENGSNKSPYLWRIFLIAAVLAGTIGLVLGRQERPRTGFLQEVTHITLAGVDSAAERGHVAAARKWIAEFEQCISSKAKDSELARVNAISGLDPVAVSEHLFEAVAAGVEWHGRTRGAFDITISPLLALWRKCGAENRLPSEAELAAARALVGANRLVLDAKKRTVAIPVEGMRIDLGGLGKGFCADAVANLLYERGVTSALVAVAGDIRVVGARADGKPWRVGIQNPRQPKNPDALIATLELSDKAVSTSGNYERFVEIQGKRYSHIVDPRSGMPANNVPSVTVVGPNALTTDIMGTALSVLGVEAGLPFVEKMPEVEAMFITFDDKDVATITRSSGFSAFEAD